MTQIHAPISLAADSAASQSHGLLAASAARMQRARGRGHIAFGAPRVGQISPRLTDLHQSGCLKLMLPRRQVALQDVVLINTAGGLTGGDALTLSAELAPNCRMRLASQTAERVYRSLGDSAEVSIRFDLGAGAEMDWLPQETLLYQGSAIQRRLEVNLADDASFLCVEPLVLGRQAMGETVTRACLNDQWRIRRAGRLVFADALRLQDFSALGQSAALGSATAMATILLVDHRADLQLQRLRPNLHSRPGLEIGASAWNGLLLARILAQEAFAMRRTLIELLTQLRQRTLPRVWTM